MSGTPSWPRHGVDVLPLSPLPPAPGVRLIQTFAVSEWFQPLKQDWVYLKIKDREAWVRQSKEGEAELCEKLPPPLDEVGFVTRFGRFFGGGGGGVFGLSAPTPQWSLIHPGSVSKCKGLLEPLVEGPQAAAFGGSLGGGGMRP